MTPHDQHVKKPISSFFCEFLEAFVPELARLVDRRHLEFLDKELIWIRRRFRTAKFVDLVAKVKLKGEPGFILIHVEHKARREREMARQMFLYAAWLIERYGLPVWPILLTSYSHPRRAELTQYQIRIRGRLILDFRYDVVQLNRLKWRDYLQRPNPAATALLARMEIGPAERVRVKAEILRLLLTMRLRPQKAELILGFVETYLELTAQEELKLRREIDRFTPIDREKIMRMLLPGERAGLRKGRQETLREDILDILEARFKDVPYELRESIQEIAQETRLKRLHRQAVLVDSLEAFARAL